MSADLFAAFGAVEAAPDSKSDQQKEQTPSSGQSNVLLPDFGTLSTSPNPASQQKLNRPKVQGERLWRQDDQGTEVLFDAVEGEAHFEDEFGDFEEVENNAEDCNVPTTGGTEADFSRLSKYREAGTQLPGTRVLSDDLLVLDEGLEALNPSGPNLLSDDLIGLDEGLNTSRPSQSRVSNVFLELPPPVAEAKSNAEVSDDWGDFSDPVNSDPPPMTKGSDEKPLRGVSQTSRKQQNIVEDDWEPFEDGEPTEPSISSSSPMKARQKPPPFASVFRSQTTQSPVEDIRPSNIPPPAVLLQLLPRVFDQLRQSASSQCTRDQYNASAIVRTFTVAARIISGRALRWKRDAILSQSMRIGPSASSGSGGRGMKLTAIDKSESLKEEQEVADVISAWEKNAYLLNATIAKAGIQRSLVMTLSSSMKPRLESGIDVLKAPHACALCGIKRDERVPQVDFKVEDSFGEFWVEYWGHRDCRDFWEKHKDMLSQR